MELALAPSSIRLEKPHREQRAVKPQLHVTGSVNGPMRCSVAELMSRQDISAIPRLLETEGP
jgi:hypothetical protein